VNIRLLLPDLSEPIFPDVMVVSGLCVLSIPGLFSYAAIRG
jgi:hypothetical protein